MTNRTQEVTQAEGDWSPLSRTDYEDAGRTLRVEPMQDGEIADSYGIRYGDFSMSHYTPEERTEMALARRRQMALDSEKQARRAAEPKPVIEMATCQRCGAEVSRMMLMNASLGTVCPDCYDEWSD